MKTRFPMVCSVALTAALTALSLTVMAHGPSLHKKPAAAAPDCSAINDMDMSKMDLTDPLMKALHDRCKDPINHGSMKHEDTHGTDQEAAPPATSGGQQ